MTGNVKEINGMMKIHTRSILEYIYVAVEKRPQPLCMCLPPVRWLIDQQTFDWFGQSNRVSEVTRLNCFSGENHWDAKERWRRAPKTFRMKILYVQYVCKLLFLLIVGSELINFFRCSRVIKYGKLFNC